MSLFDLLIGIFLFFYFELKLLVFVMTKALSNGGICLIKAVLLLCEHGHFFQQISKIVFFTPRPKKKYYLG